jgi:putative membrane protein
MNPARPFPVVVPGPRELALYLAVVVAILAWSGIAADDRFTWFLEVIWVFVALPLVPATWRKFPLTRLLVVLIVLHMLVLMVGGRWTYAKVPLGFWVQDALDLSRNHYDRLGHFMQGFEPAILGRELLLRLTPLKRGGWLFYLVVSACLAFSAFFEFIEWWSALAWGGEADAFLATQGDVWDTQWDMFLAMIGAITAQVLLSRWHDRQLGPAILAGK